MDDESSDASDIESNNELLKGVVVDFNEGSGYGFITCDDGSGDVFVHFSDIKGTKWQTLEVGAKVEFKVMMWKGKGRKAINVTGPGGADITIGKPL